MASVTNAACHFAPVDPRVGSGTIGLNARWQGPITRPKRWACVGCCKLHLSAHVCGVRKSIEVVTSCRHCPKSGLGTGKRASQSNFTRLAWNHRPPTSKTVLSGSCHRSRSTRLKVGGQHFGIASHICGSRLFNLTFVTTPTGPSTIARTVICQSHQRGGNGSEKGIELFESSTDSSNTFTVISSRWSFRDWLHRSIPNITDLLLVGIGNVG